MDSAVRPVDERERIVVLDVLRGLAVPGMLLVNMGMYANPLGTTGGEPAPVASALIRFFAEGKFYALFSMLFGLGLAVFTERAERAGRKVVPLYARRLVVLGGIGLVHGTLIWAGDILLVYAILGFVLLAMRKVRPWVLLLVAVLLLLLQLAILAGYAILSTRAGSVAPEQSVASIVAAYNGAASAVFAQRFKDWLSLFVQGLAAGPVILAYFLFGLWVGRRGLMHDLAAHRRLLWRGLWIGLAVGVPLAALPAILSLEAVRLPGLVRGVVAAAATMIGGAPLAIAYASGTALWMGRPTAQRVLGALAPVGRMALSNYLMHSVVFTTLFYGYGLGVFGRVGTVTGLWLTLAMFVFQLVFSRFWLRRYRFGPVEWLWRSLTYGQRQPMRRAPPALAAVT